METGNRKERGREGERESWEDGERWMKKGLIKKSRRKEGRRRQVDDKGKRKSDTR